VVAGVRDLQAASALLGVHPNLRVVELDVTDGAEVRSGVAEAERFAGGALDAVVSNAGYALLGAVEDVDLDEVRAVLETNALGALAVVQAALPAMREAGRGTAVFVSTLGAGLPVPLLGAYRASKAALNAFAEALSMETRPYGIRVSRVEPGWTPDGRLLVVSDSRDGWWNLHEVDLATGALTPLHADDQEVGGPAWVFGEQHHADEVLRVAHR